MTIDVKLFARARELVGAGVVTVEWDNELTVARLRTKLVSSHPRLADILPRCVIAVRNEYAEEDHIIAAGDEVAVIPPVSGG